MEYTVTAKYKGLYPDNALESKMDVLVGKRHENHGGYIDDQVRDVDWFFSTQLEAFNASLALSGVSGLIDVELGTVEDGCGLPKYP